jgi:transposase
MASIRREFTDEFKAEAVRLVTVEGHSARQVAKDLGIHESLPRRWRRKLEVRQARAAGVSPSGTVAASALVEQEEIRKLKRENERLRMERDVLKNPRRPAAHLWPEKPLPLMFLRKAIAIFTETQR